MPPPPALDITEAFPHRPEADSFDFRRSWRVVRHACSGHKLLIAMTCAATVGLVVLYIVYWPPIYTAQAELVAQSGKDTTRAGFYQEWAVFRSDDLADEVQLITAAPVLEAVVDKLGLTYDDVYHPFLSQAGYLWTQSWPGRIYRQAKEWVFPPHRGRYAPTPAQIDRARILVDFKSGASLVRVPETDVGELVVKGPSPRVAEIANTIVAVYFKQRRDRQIQEAEDAYQALAAELKTTKGELSTLEQRMQKYYSQNGLLLAFEKDKIDIGHWEALKTGITDLKTSIAGQQQSLATVDALLANEQKDVVAARVVQANPVDDTMRAKLAELELTRKQTLIHFRPDSPDIQELDKQIAIINQQIAREPKDMVRQTTVALSTGYETLRTRKAQLETDLAGLRASLAVRVQAADEYRTMVDRIPEKMRAVHDFDREHQQLEKKYAALSDKLMIAVVSRASARSAPPSIHVVEAASAPGEPGWPKTKLLLLAAILLGLIAGVLLALLMDLLHGRVNRHRLASGEWDLSVYAIIGRDRIFAAGLFPPPDGAAAGSERARLGSRL